MPRYDYQCQKCMKQFEQFQSISTMYEPENEPCSECGELAVKKIIAGAPAIGDPVRLGIRRPDGGFKEVLQKIHEKVPGSNINSDSRYY